MHRTLGRAGEAAVSSPLMQPPHPSERTPVTVQKLLAIPPEERFHEIINGELVRKATPTGEHGDAQSSLISLIKGPFQRRAGGGQPGGWWLYTDVEVELGPTNLYRPDIVGWRRERVPERPTGTPIRIRPGFICEVVSPSSAATDRVKKLKSYHHFQIPNYWIVDPVEESFSVFRWTNEGYLLVLVAGRDERVKAEPFDAIEIPVAVLFGGDHDDDAES